MIGVTNAQYDFSINKLDKNLGVDNSGKILKVSNTGEIQAVINDAVGSVLLTIDNTNYVVTLQAKDTYGNSIGSAQTIDLPLESVVVSGNYDSTTKKVILTLQNGNTVEFSVADLIDGLQTEIKYAYLTIQSTDWVSIPDSTYFSYKTTININVALDTNDIVELINNNPTLFTDYGFAIGDISNNIITIYANNQPTTNVTLAIQITKAKLVTIQEVEV